MNKEIIGFKLNSIRKFTGSSFVEIFNIYPFFVYPVNVMSDTIINTFLIPGILNDSPSDIMLFHWNGSKWSKELSLAEYGRTISSLKNVQEKYFFLVLDHFNKTSHLGVGTKKTQ